MKKTKCRSKEKRQTELNSKLFPDKKKYMTSIILLYSDKLLHISISGFRASSCTKGNMPDIR